MLEIHVVTTEYFMTPISAVRMGVLWKPEALERLVGYARSQGLDVSLEDSPTIYAAYRELAVHRDDRIDAPGARVETGDQPNHAAQDEQSTAQGFV